MDDHFDLIISIHLPRQKLCSFFLPHPVPSYDFPFPPINPLHAPAARSLRQCARTKSTMMELRLHLPHQHREFVEVHARPCHPKLPVFFSPPLPLPSLPSLLPLLRAAPRRFRRMARGKGLYRAARRTLVVVAHSLRFI